MTVSTTPSASPLPGCHLSVPTSRQLLDDLVDDAEQQALLDAVAIEREYVEDLSEMVCGWGCSVSMPKRRFPSSKRPGLRRRAPKTDPPAIDSSKIVVRCVSDDYNTEHHKSAWKANVEPGTYRYIANNGIYRSTKFANIGTDWITAKRSKFVSERGSNSLEVRQAQKTLRKDLDQHFKSGDPGKQSPATFNPLPVKDVNRTPSSDTVNRGTTPTVTTIATTATITTTTRNAMRSPHTAPSHEPRPPKDPSLVKSASDLFVENFSSRITAIEKEMDEAKDKSAENLLKPGTNPSTALTVISASHTRRQQQQQDGFRSTPDPAKFLARQAEDIAKDVFTVRPVLRAEQPLNPLEKLTPQQKMAESRTNGSDKTSNISSSNPESPILPTSFMTAMNAFSQIHHQHHREDNMTKSNPPTFRSNQRHSGGNGLVVNNQHPVGVHSAASDSDSLSSVRNALTLTNKDIEKMRMRSSTNQLSMREYNRFISSTAKFSTSAFGRGLAAKRKGVVGYKAIPSSHNSSNNNNNNNININTQHHLHHFQQPLHASNVPPNHQANQSPYLSGRGVPCNSGVVEDVRSVTSDSGPESCLGPPSTFAGGNSLRDSKASSMSLPEISGKRLSVTTTTQRML